MNYCAINGLLDYSNRENNFYQKETIALRFALNKLLKESKDKQIQIAMSAVNINKLSEESLENLNNNFDSFMELTLPWIKLENSDKINITKNEKMAERFFELFPDKRPK